MKIPNNFLLLITLTIPTNMLPSTKMIENRSLGNPNYGTHMVPLVTAVVNTNGPVLEMGCGDYSTPLLHAICSSQKRILVTTDTDKQWLHLFMDLETDWHQFIYVPVYDDDKNLNPKPHIWNTIGNDHHWSVVLIDHRPGERRKVDIQRLRNNVEIFVVHDTQYHGYKYEPVLATFKYRFVYKRYKTQTTLVSDTIDIQKFFEEK